MRKNEKKPIVMVFAGPNGSGKTTIANALDEIGAHVNADDLKVMYELTDLEAAQQAERLRNTLLENRESFSFETVLSTDRNLLFLERAKALGYEVQCVYVLTCNEDINIARIRVRHAAGGHDVPEEKTRSRYHKALALIPWLVTLCDDLLIYDNSIEPIIICEKNERGIYLYPNELWSLEALQRLLSDK